MKLQLSEHFTMPAASLYLFEITMLLILIPIVDRILYPTLRHFGFDFTPLRKMGVGMLFAMGSVIMAGLMEIERKKYIDAHGYFEQHPFDTPVNASQMNIFYQVPQYVLQGTGEVLTSIPGKWATCRALDTWVGMYGAHAWSQYFHSMQRTCLMPHGSYIYTALPSCQKCPCNLVQSHRFNIQLETQIYKVLSCPRLAPNKFAPSDGTR